MRLWIIGFFIGCCSLLWQNPLPNFYIINSIFIIAILGTIISILYKRFYLLPIFAILFGCAWGTLNAQWQLQQRLPNFLEDKIVLISGHIVSLPESQSDITHFNFDIEKLTYDNHNYSLPKKIRLSWYFPQQILQAGDRWQLLVKLKAPRSTLNPGEFDFARWLFEQKIGALAYVVNSPNNILLKPTWYFDVINKIRQHLALGITQSLTNLPLTGFITALVVGTRGELTVDQWQTLQGTGTNHLIAIAGLHIGFVAGFAFFIASFIWRRLGYLPLFIPTPQVAAASALITAIIYSALAGFALPTQRAILMLEVFLLSTLLRRNLPPWHAWFLALLIILLWDPLIVLADSFWLSFGSVALILYGSSGRTQQLSGWRKWLRIQWLIAIGLIPLSLLFFHQVAWTGFIANAIAIPWVGFIVLPLSLLGSLLWLILPKLGSLLLITAEKALELLWPILQYLANLKPLLWLQYLPNVINLISITVAVLLILAPRGIPGRWLAVIFVLPLLLWQAPKPDIGTIWFSLLDVGQGLSAVVRTQHHTLVFDTGMKYSDNFDMGSAVVIPYLRQAGIKQIDTLIISHGDLDHSGGANSILNSLPVKQLLSSVPERFPAAITQACAAGQHWIWDQVTFDVLYPPIGQLNLDNDSSCVLQISTGNNHILLTGDIEARSEYYLLTHAAEKLKTTILIAPHHGSKTSSTTDFVSATQPDYVLFPVGYHNRFHFPSQIVMNRYLDIHAVLFDSATNGMISFIIKPDRIPSLPILFRQQAGRYWD